MTKLLPMSLVLAVGMVLTALAAPVAAQLQPIPQARPITAKALQDALTALQNARNQLAATQAATSAQQALAQAAAAMQANPPNVAAATQAIQAAANAIGAASPNAQQALNRAVAALQASPPNLVAAVAALADAQRAIQQTTPAAQARAQAIAALQQALAALQLARSTVCCQQVVVQGCPATKDCAKTDACVIIQLPPLAYSRPAFSSQGTISFVTLINNAVARGTENVMIRAMNATKACESCKPVSANTQPCAP